MRRLFDYWGYSNELDYKNKVIYPFTLLSIGVGFLYFALYLWLVPFIPAIIVQILFVLVNVANLFVMRRKHFDAAKLILTLSFVIQLTLAVYVWFPVKTGFNFYYLSRSVKY